MDGGKETSNYNQAFVVLIYTVTVVVKKSIVLIGLIGLVLPSTKVLLSIFMYAFIHTGIFFFTGINFLRGENLGYCNDLLIVLRAFHRRQGGF